MYKLFEPTLNNRILTSTNLEHQQFPSAQQQSFLKQMSCAITALTIHETINTIFRNFIFRTTEWISPKLDRKNSHWKIIRIWESNEGGPYRGSRNMQKGAQVWQIL